MYGGKMYIYDGSLEGLLTVVFETWTVENAEISCTHGYDGGEISVVTNPVKAARVLKWIKEKLPAGTMERIYDFFYSDAPKKEQLIYKYLKACHRLGKWVDSFMTDEAVVRFLNAEKSFNHESMRMYDVVKFSVLQGGVMYTEISTGFNQIQKLGRFFSTRMAGTRFIIYDREREAAVLSNGYKWLTANEINEKAATELKNIQNFESRFTELLKSLSEKEKNANKLQQTLMNLKYRKYIEKR